VSDVVVCDRVSKSYRPSGAVGIKERLVGRRRREHGLARHWALRDITFCVAQGRGLGIIGSNGSGKSTLMSLLLGVLRPDAGSIAVHGRVASLLALGAGFHPELTGRQNVFLYGSVLGMRLAELRTLYDGITDFAEIGDAVDYPLRTYSSGMITRLGFSTIIHTPADVLLIDEVLAVGDMAFQAKCRDFLAGFRRKGGTLVVVSHDLKSLRELCDDGLWISEGRIGRYGDIGEVIDSYIAASTDHEAIESIHLS